MIELIHEQVIKHPERIAYVSDGKSITYQGLWREASALAGSLHEEGNEPVIIYGHKQIGMLVSMLACLLANRPYVPVDVQVPLAMIKTIIKASQATHILNQQSTNQITEVNQWQYQEHLDHKSYIDNSIDGLAYIMFTSGTTALPKGVKITRRNLANFVNWISNFESLKGQDNLKILNQASFNFDLSVMDIYYGLYNGHTIVALTKDDQTDYRKMFSIISEYKINMLVLTPTFLRLCLLEPKFNGYDYPDIKIIYSCGECLPKSLATKLFKRFPQIKLINAYGPTEGTSAVSAVLITEEMLKFKSLPIGKIGATACDIKIVNETINLQGKSVFAGYLDDSNNTDKSYDTKDLGYIENGYLFWSGRQDTQVKYKGYRINLTQVEETIKLITGIEDCAVITKSSNEIVQYIQVFVIINDPTLTEEHIRKQLSDYFPSYLVPKKISIIDNLPKNQNYKLDRRKLYDNQ